MMIYKIYLFKEIINAKTTLKHKGYLNFVKQFECPQCIQCTQQSKWHQ